ncbi:hypothetical protein [Crossiella equi]|uniref:MmyB family transcriptional regulator n=1 Tax=Crossiella equi TaxID=130796 RepID=UPI00130285BD|nr:hypothetical protein [Crossiella equi]
MRAATGRPPHPPRLTELVDELSMRSTRFRQLWIYQAAPGSESEAALRHLRQDRTRY